MNAPRANASSASPTTTSSNAIRSTSTSSGSKTNPSKTLPISRRPTSSPPRLSRTWRPHWHSSLRSLRIWAGKKPKRTQSKMDNPQLIRTCEQLQFVKSLLIGTLESNNLIINRERVTLAIERIALIEELLSDFSQALDQVRRENEQFQRARTVDLAVEK